MHTVDAAWKRFVRILIVGVLLAVVSTVVLSPHTATSQVSTTPLTGWLWTDTTGWISLNCADVGSCATSNYKVSQDTNGNLSGYGWSDNVGWVTFNAAQLTGCPQTQTGNTSCAPQLLLGSLKGWIRVCSGMDNTSLNQASPNNACTNAAGTRTDGFDGWISLYGSAPIAYGSTVGAGGLITGFAWGSDVTGWVQFNATSPASCVPQPSYCDATGKSCAFNTTTCAWGCNFCQYGCGVGGQCDGPPLSSGAIEAHPTLLQSGNKATISWWAKNVLSDCDVEGSNGDGSPNGWQVGDGTTSGSYDGANASTTASRLSSAVVGQTIYTLTCTGLDSLPHQWTVTVNPSPHFEEQ